MAEASGNSFDGMKFLNPWEVKIDEEALKDISKILDEHPILSDVFTRFLGELETFPPNEDHFKEPKRSFYEEGIWLTVTDGHLRLAVFVEYRKYEGVCWVVKVLVDVSKLWDRFTFWDRGE